MSFSLKETSWLQKFEQILFSCQHPPKLLETPLYKGVAYRWMIRQHPPSIHQSSTKSLPTVWVASGCYVGGIWVATSVEVRWKFDGSSVEVWSQPKSGNYSSVDVWWMSGGCYTIIHRPISPLYKGFSDIFGGCCHFFKKFLL